ncbi:MAG: hypothetical protein HGB02_03415 [Chlorobiaceae bacterium]|nr:hypothetical protein [Chlorobiaceae bacterium]
MTRSHYIIKWLPGQRGSASIWFVLCLPVLLGFAALSVDLARLNLIKVELQNAADAAALGGAYAISVPSSSKKDQPYNWTAAIDRATKVATSNFANGAKITDATVETGYWNLKASAVDGKSCGTGCVPYVRATVTISSTENNGPVKFFFAPIFHVAQSNIQASATAVTGPPSGGTGMFPWAIDESFLLKNWKAYKQGKSLTIASVYKGGHGQWSSLMGNTSADSYIDGLMTKGNSNYLAINSSDTKIYIANGAMSNLYGDAAGLIGSGKIFAVPVVQTLAQGSSVPILEIAAFQIDSVKKNGANSTVTGHFIDGYTFPGLTLGDGHGKLYGAFTAPVLVQ